MEYLLLNCIAEYDDKGQGEPTFWAERFSSEINTVFDKVAQVDDCGIAGWALPESSEVITLSQRDPATLPSNLRSYLVSNQTQNALADKNGVAITINKGQESLEQYYGKYAYPKWQLPSGAQLVSHIDASTTAIDTTLSTQGSIVKAAEAYLTTWLANNQKKAQSYATLETQAQAKAVELAAFTKPWLDELSAVTTKLTIYDFQVSVAQSRTDAESLEFITKVKAYKEKAAKLQQNSNGLNALVEGAKFAQKMHSFRKLGDANRCHKCNRLSFIGFRAASSKFGSLQCHFSIREPVCASH